jgi:two-component system, chemotaxis family, chemotaxis protein CheY
MSRLLVVDESEDVRRNAAKVLRELGFQSQLAENSLAALAICNRALPRAIIVDAGLHAALELIAAIRAMPGGRAVRILYAPARVDLRQLMAAKAAGADDFALKPFDAKCLGQALQDLRVELRKVAATRTR